MFANFPVWIPLGPWRLHPHAVFELLAYAIGFRLFLRARRRLGDAIATNDRILSFAGAAVGALVGAKILAWLERPHEALEHLGDPAWWFGGKTVVGGLLGGRIGVEIVKRRIGVTRSTGDLFAVPLALSIAIGRVGCFLSGLDDHTHGLPSAVPWAIDFGDGVARHPTQIYEIGFLLVLAILLARVRRQSSAADGDRFRLFFTLYFLWRLGIDFLKPERGFYLGLDGIQAAIVVTLVYDYRHLRRLAGVVARAFRG